MQDRETSQLQLEELLAYNTKLEAQLNNLQNQSNKAHLKNKKNYQIRNQRFKEINSKLNQMQYALEQEKNDHSTTQLQCTHLEENVIHLQEALIDQQREHTHTHAKLRETQKLVNHLTQITEYESQQRIQAEQALSVSHLNHKNMHKEINMLKEKVSGLKKVITSIPKSFATAAKNRRNGNI